MGSQRMVHHLGGPADGEIALMDASRHPFRLSLPSDTDGYYVMLYNVAGQRLGTGDLILTNEDVIAQWHQRSSPVDFQTADTVIVIATGERATVWLPTTFVSDDGTTEETWMVTVDGEQRYVRPDQIRVARPDEIDPGSE